jgi:hypothetical protein
VVAIPVGVDARASVAAAVVSAPVIVPAVIRAVIRVVGIIGIVRIIGVVRVIRIVVVVGISKAYSEVDPARSGIERLVASGAASILVTLVTRRFRFFLDRLVSLPLLVALLIVLLQEFNQFVRGAGLLEIHQIVRAQLEGELVSLDKSLDAGFGHPGVEQV